MEGKVIFALSPVDTSVNSWALNSGTKLLNYKTCSSPHHGLTSVGTRFIASSQVPASKSASSTPIYFWSWDKIFSLSEDKILRSIPLDSVADALAIDPGEHRFYAGCRDGKIYIKALNAENNPTIGILFDHSVFVTSIACQDGNMLVSGSEDGIIRIWDIKTQHVIRVLKHAKGSDSRLSTKFHISSVAFQNTKLAYNPIRVGPFVLCRDLCKYNLERWPICLCRPVDPSVNCTGLFNCTATP